MLFNSLPFIIFFPLIVALYFALPHRWRWALLLAASYYFYMCWKVEYVLLIFASTIVDYWVAIKMASIVEKSRKKIYLGISLFVNLGLLFSFKYFNFVNDNLREAFDQFNIFYDVPAFDVLLPVGISFYTFQTLSYTIDVYRGEREPEKHLGIFALFVSFFPQLVAGPIERSRRLLPQFRKVIVFDYARVADGMRLVLWGFFKKIVIADRLAAFVDIVYNNPGDYYGLTVVIGTVFFAFQIYCDFSGYSDIAIGTARIMGFDLMQNFNRPYFSKSISEFWRRWHISLSTWFKDYVYISLGGNRVVKWRWYYNLFITFLLSGFWHGANWTFLAWGAIHGVYLVAAILTDAIQQRFYSATGMNSSPQIKKLFDVSFIFTLVCLAWVFFRANNIGDAFTLLENMAKVDVSAQVAEIFRISGGMVKGVVSFSLLVLLLVLEFAERGKPLSQVIASKPVLIRWGIYCGFLWTIIYLGVFEETSFIYFQF